MKELIEEESEFIKQLGKLEKKDICEYDNLENIERSVQDLKNGLNRGGTGTSVYDFIKDNKEDATLILCDWDSFGGYKGTVRKVKSYLDQAGYYLFENKIVDFFTYDYPAQDEDYEISVVQIERKREEVEKLKNSMDRYLASMERRCASSEKEFIDEHIAGDEVPFFYREYGEGKDKYQIVSCTGVDNKSKDSVKLKVETFEKIEDADARANFLTKKGYVSPSK